MSKSIRTICRNGQIELPPEVQLPDNTYVTVILPDDLPEDAEPAFSIPALAQDIGPEDLSRDLEHYLYGHPKQLTHRPRTSSMWMPLDGSR
jgi:hypothetical protein